MKREAILCAALMGVAAAADEAVTIGRFCAGELRDRQPKSFKGQTRYALGETGGRCALFADSRGTASSLYR